MLLVLVVIALGVTLYRNVIEPNVRLNRAQALIAAGRYDDGYALLEELGRSGSDTTEGAKSLERLYAQELQEVTGRAELTLMEELENQQRREQQ